MIDTLEDLLQIPDMIWGLYAFSKDPLNRKLTDEKRKQIIEDSIKCGITEAIKVKKEFGNIIPSEYAGQMEVEIKREDSYISHDYIMFAKFNEPSKITIYTDNIDKINKYMNQNKIHGMLKYVEVSEMLVAHELFHYRESINPNIFTGKKLIELWGIGPFKYRSSLIAPKEIAAMAFSRELLNLNFNPFIFDVLMLYPYDFEQANLIFNKLVNKSIGIND